MFDDGNEDKCEDQRCVKDILRCYGELDKEAKMLTAEKEDLLTIEEELRFMLSEELENRRMKNLSLRREIEEQKRKCVELTKILNASIRAQ